MTRLSVSNCRMIFPRPAHCVRMFLDNGQLVNWKADRNLVQLARSNYQEAYDAGAMRTLSVRITSGNNPFEELEFPCNRLAPRLG